MKQEINWGWGHINFIVQLPKNATQIGLEDNTFNGGIFYIVYTPDNRVKQEKIDLPPGKWENLICSKTATEKEWRSVIDVMAYSCSFGIHREKDYVGFGKWFLKRNGFDPDKNNYAIVKKVR